MVGLRYNRVHVQITEPMTMATDYLLGAVCLVLGLRLWRHPEEGSRSVRLWAGAFFATTAAAVTGGTFHGLTLHLDAETLAALWKLTVWAIGAAGFLMVSAVAVAELEGAWKRTVVALAGLKFALYAVWMATHNQFRYVIIDYAPSLAVIFGIELWALRARGAGSSPSAEPARWILAGIALSVAAAGVQAAGVSLHPQFNHNDLYHVIQMVAFYLLYRGGRLLTDR